MKIIAAQFGNTQGGNGLNMSGWQLGFPYTLYLNSFTGAGFEVGQDFSAFSTLRYRTDDRTIQSGVMHFTAVGLNGVGVDSAVLHKIDFYNAAGLRSFTVEGIDQYFSILGGSVVLDYFTIVPGEAPAQLNVLIGNDVVVGNRFNDTLLGGLGNDKITAALGNDLANGGFGNDALNGNDGNDVLVGEFGSDFIYGSKGEDNIVGDETVEGGGRDFLYGGEGSDYFLPGGGTDTIHLGADRAEDFVSFSYISDSLPGKRADKIFNFKASVDFIDFMRIDGNENVRGEQSLSWGGTRPTNYGVWWVDRDKNVVIRVDVDGDRRADLEVELVNVDRVSAGDFAF